MPLIPENVIVIMKSVSQYLLARYGFRAPSRPHGPYSRKGNAERSGELVQKSI